MAHIRTQTFEVCISRSGSLFTVDVQQGITAMTEVFAAQQVMSCSGLKKARVLSVMSRCGHVCWFYNVQLENGHFRYDWKADSDVVCSSRASC